MNLSGVLAPVPTPFDDRDQVDARKLTAAFARWVKGPLTGFVILGSNGEAALMDEEESDRVIAVAREAVPRDRTFLVGTGRESTRATIAATKRAAALGADAVLVRTPGFYKSQMTTAAFVRHYTAVAEDQEFSPLRPLVDWLDYNGFAVVTKPLKEFTDAQGRRRVKGNMDIELAIDVMELADSVDHIVIFSGDGDFRRLVEAVQKKGRRVSIVSTIRTQPPMVADELRRQADNFIELDDLRPTIMREGGPRSANHHQPAPQPAPSNSDVASSLRSVRSRNPRLAGPA